MLSQFEVEMTFHTTQVITEVHLGVISVAVTDELMCVQYISTV
jgi:hypothetical protein